jgi:putative transposase
MLVAHKIALDPTNVQRTYFAKASGVARFAYNWALEQWQRQYQAGEKPTEATLRKQLNYMKAEAFPWMLEVGKVAPQQAIKDLGSAFQRFFRGEAHYPRFKRKGVHDSFRADNGPSRKGVDAVEVHGTRIRLPRIGWIRMREALRFRGHIKSAVVSRMADRWFVSLLVDLGDVFTSSRENQAAAVGVDMGVKALATLSTGEVIEGPKPYRALILRVRRLSKSLSRKQKGSANWRKAKVRIARFHARIANIRRDALHKLTTRLTLEFSHVVIEDLHIKGMLSNRHLARAIADCGLHEFRRQITYKAKWYGCKVITADRWYPSSKTCSACRVIYDGLTLDDRVWLCPHCGTWHDRDRNAALNLKKLAVSSTVTACGEEGADCIAIDAVKPASTKQESNMTHPNGILVYI